MTEKATEQPAMTVALTDEQRSTIFKATGVDVKELNVFELKGEAARVLGPHVLAAKVAVMCW